MRMLSAIAYLWRILCLCIRRAVYGPRSATVLLHPGCVPAATVIRTVGSKLTMVRMVVRPGTYVASAHWHGAIYIATDTGWKREDPPSRTEVIVLDWLRDGDPALASYQVV